MNSKRESRDMNGRTRQKTTGKPENETTDNKQRETSGYVGTTESEIGTPAGHKRPEGRRERGRDDEGTEGRTVATLLGLRRERERGREREGTLLNDSLVYRIQGPLYTILGALRTKGTKGNEPK